MSTLDPSYLQVLHPWIQPTQTENTWKKNSESFKKAKLEFAKGY